MKKSDRNSSRKDQCKFLKLLREGTRTVEQVLGITKINRARLGRWLRAKYFAAEVREILAGLGRVNQLEKRIFKYTTLPKLSEAVSKIQSTPRNQRKLAKAVKDQERPPRKRKKGKGAVRARPREQDDHDQELMGCIDKCRAKRRRP